MKNVPDINPWIINESDQLEEIVCQEVEFCYDE